MAVHPCCVHCIVHTGSQSDMWLAMNLCESYMFWPSQVIEIFPLLICLSGLSYGCVKETRIQQQFQTKSLVNKHREQINIGRFQPAASNNTFTFGSWREWRHFRAIFSWIKAENCIKSCECF